MDNKPTVYIRNRPLWDHMQRQLDKAKEGLPEKTLAIRWHGHTAIAEPQANGSWELFIDGYPVELSKQNAKFIWDVTCIAVDKIRGMR